MRNAIMNNVNTGATGRAYSDIYETTEGMFDNSGVSGEEVYMEVNKKSKCTTVIGWIAAILGVISVAVVGLILLGIIVAIVAFVLIGKLIIDLTLPLIGPLVTGAVLLGTIIVLAALALLIKIAIPFI